MIRSASNTSNLINIRKVLKSKSVDFLVEWVFITNLFPRSSSSSHHLHQMLTMSFTKLFLLKLLLFYLFCFFCQLWQLKSFVFGFFISMMALSLYLSHIFRPVKGWEGGWIEGSHKEEILYIRINKLINNLIECGNITDTECSLNIVFC